MLYNSAKLCKLAYLDPVTLDSMKKSVITPIFHTCQVSGADAYTWWCDKEKEMTLVFRGTKGRKDLIKDIDIRQLSMYNNNGLKIHVHRGFLEQFLSIERSLMKELEAHPDISKLTFTGHSLGAALASIAASKIKANTGIPTNLHTFGSPRVGSKEFSIWSRSVLDVHKRVVHKQDPVGRVPTTWYYHHIGGDYILFDDENRYKIMKKDPPYLRRLYNILTKTDITNPIEDHSMNRYVEFAQTVGDVDMKTSNSEL